jgi:hypothetical protein
MDGSPFTLGSIFNKAIKTDLAGSEDFIWNLTYCRSNGLEN